MVNAVPWSSKMFVGAAPNPTTVKVPDSPAFSNLEEPMPNEVLVGLLFENIGGTELINLARHDTIDGTPVAYNAIKNVSLVNDMFNSINMISGWDTRDTFFSQYQIDIMKRIKEVYFDSQGNLVLDFYEMSPNENVEIDILVNGVLYTI